MFVYATHNWERSVHDYEVPLRSDGVRNAKKHLFTASLYLLLYTVNTTQLENK